MHIHFTGICGTAMATAAVMVKSLGHHVTGSDTGVYPPMSTYLEANNIKIFDGFSEKNLIDKPDLVVIGNVVSRGNLEAEAVLSQKIRYVSLPELLKEYFIRGKKSIVITGTHGKTTTTSLMAWIFESAKKSPGFMIGGLPLNFTSSGSAGSGEYFIIEGDEYDTAFFDKRSKFVHYLPDTLVINNIEFDHADIYDNLEQIKLSFRRLINIVPQNGLILVNAENSNAMDVVAKSFTPVQTFAINSDAYWKIEKYKSHENGMSFSVIRDGKHFGDFVLPMWGEHNLSNALACIASASHNKILSADIAKALKNFKGIKRRLELRALINGIRVYDDFAHHPTAIKSTIKSVKENMPNKRIWAVFEPRSNTSRTNLMQDKLAESLTYADSVIIAGIKSMGKIEVSKRLDIKKVVSDIKSKGIEAYSLPDADTIVEFLSKELKDGDVVLAMSNGGFDNFHEKLITKLRELYEK